MTDRSPSAPAPASVSPPSSEARIDVWVALLRAQRRALGQVEAALKQAALPPLSWYDALLELRRADEAGMRQGALEQAMLLEQYNVSRLIDRLVAAGLVERRPDPEDGRAKRLVVTPAGRAMLERMWPVYRAAVDEAFGAGLGADDLQALGGLLPRIAADD